MLLLGVLATMTTLVGQRRSATDDMVIQQAVNQLLAYHTFRFDVNRILTSGTSNAMFGSINAMEVDGDTLRLNLPYVGKGTISTENNMGNPLQFVTSNFTYKVSIGRKNRKVVTMEVISPQRTRFTFTLTITKGNMARLLIVSAARSPMEYSGFIREVGVFKSPY